MNTVTKVASTEQKRAVLANAVRAQLAYLAALDAVEELYLEPGTMGDKQCDSLHDLVASLADAQPAGDATDVTVTPEHIVSLDRILQPT